MTRALGDAAVVGTLLALVVDVLLQGALAAVRLDDGLSSWLVATLFDGGRWVLAALLLRLVAPLAWPGDRPPALADRPAVFAIVGRAMVVAPPIWTATALVLRAVRITVEGGWPYEGRVFLAPDFYAALLVGYAPWALGGLAVVALARHAPPIDPHA
jgi:hypothetical protein